jgi:hypothetical protein
MSDPTGVCTLVRAFGAFHSAVYLLKGDIINGSISDGSVVGRYRQELGEKAASLAAAADDVCLDGSERAGPVVQSILRQLEAHPFSSDDELKDVTRADTLVQALCAQVRALIGVARKDYGLSFLDQPTRELLMRQRLRRSQ